MWIFHYIVTIAILLLKKYSFTGHDCINVDGFKVVMKRNQGNKDISLLVHGEVVVVIERVPSISFWGIQKDSSMDIVMVEGHRKTIETNNVKEKEILQIHYGNDTAIVVEKGENLFNYTDY